MLDKLKKNKSALITLVVIAILILIYWLLRGEEGPVIPLSETQEQLVGQELLNELERLRALRVINFEEFLANPILNSLKDTEVEPVPQTVGRNNPFTSPAVDI
jgi:hypothetical protein